MMTGLMNGNWYGIRDGDPRARAMLNRHYSGIQYADGRRPMKVMGPAEYMLLMTLDSLAVFGWVHNTVDRRDGQVGIYCSLFRNEGHVLSSELITEADMFAWQRWPGQRHFTYVDPSKVRSPNPGYCFLMAGWHRDGWSKSGKLRLAIDEDELARRAEGLAA